MNEEEKKEEATKKIKKETELKKAALNDQRDQAILVLHETKKVKAPQSLIRDKSHNDEFKKQFEAVEHKIVELEGIMDKLAHRLPQVSRENHFLPMLHDLLLMVNSCFSKVHTESTRIGILKR